MKPNSDQPGEPGIEPGTSASTDEILSPTAGQTLRKPWRAPRLEFYGRVEQLTQNTSMGNMTDGSGMMRMSDRRLKQRLQRVGTHPLGFGLYLFEYIKPLSSRLGSGRRFGVLAQEVATVVPDAVRTNAAGWLMVDYARLGIRLAP